MQRIFGKCLLFINTSLLKQLKLLLFNWNNVLSRICHRFYQVKLTVFQTIKGKPIQLDQLILIQELVVNESRFIVLLFVKLIFSTLYNTNNGLNTIASIFSLKISQLKRTWTSLNNSIFSTRSCVSSLSLQFSISGSYLFLFVYFHFFQYEKKEEEANSYHRWWYMNLATPKQEQYIYTYDIVKGKQTCQITLQIDKPFSLLI